MTLLILLVLLPTPYLLFTVVGKWVRALRFPPAIRARVGLSLFFVFTSIGHFVKTEEMVSMLRVWMPFRIELIYVTGGLELLGAIGVWIPRLTRVMGFLLILLLVGVLPANVYSAINRVEFGGHDGGPAYLLVRVPFQIIVIWWTYFSTEQNWFRRNPARPTVVS